MEPNPSAQDIMDVETFKLNFQGVENIALDIIDLFGEQSSFLIAKISRSIEANSPTDLELNAHSLKGAVATFHASKCRQLAFDLELLGKAKTTDGAQSILSDLEDELRTLNTVLQKLKQELR